MVVYAEHQQAGDGLALMGCHGQEFAALTGAFTFLTFWHLSETLPHCVDKVVLHRGQTSARGAHSVVGLPPRS